MSLLEEKKTIFRALEKKEEKLAIEIARRLDLPEDGQLFWVIRNEYLDDPKVRDLKVKRESLIREINRVYWEIARLEHDPNNSRMNFNARKYVWSFLNDLGDSYDACEFLQTIGMTSHELIEEVARNPSFMDGVFL